MLEGFSPEHAAAIRDVNDVLDPVPHISDPDNAPLHMSEGQAWDHSHTNDANGQPAVGKNGPNRYVAHESDLFDHRGDPLPIVPVYSDALGAGTVILPYSQKPYRIHGGSGFGSMPERYGKYAWAMLHKPGDTYTAPQRAIANHWETMQRLGAGHGGVLGLVWRGTNNSLLGNVTLQRAMQHELDHLRHHDPELYESINNGFLKFPRQYPNKKVAGHFLAGDRLVYSGLDDFIRRNDASSVSCGKRFERMSELIKKSPQPSTAKPRKNYWQDDDGYNMVQFIKRVTAALTDTRNVPKGHGHALVRFSTDEPRLDLDQHPAYKFMYPGTYLGELQHTVPLWRAIPQIARGPLPNGKYIVNGYIRDNPYSEVTRIFQPAVREQIGKSISDDVIHYGGLDGPGIDWAILRHAIHPKAQHKLFKMVFASVDHTDDKQ